MIKSMTAFAKAAHTADTITADVTIRAYNSRFLDFAVYLPESCQPLEEDIKKIISRVHQRGRIEIRLNILDETPESDGFEADTARAASYYRALNDMAGVLGLTEKPSMDQVLSARNIILPIKAEVDEKALHEAVFKAVEAASAALDLMRQREGENLYTDLAGRMDFIERNMADIETKAGEIPQVYKKRLMERISRLTADADHMDPVRLAQEAAILADKSDVSEEIVRVHSHIALFRETLAAGTSQGRKLNFLIQEFNREFNTIGSKAGNAALSHAVVDLKSELEKIREQVQNIE